MNNNDRINLIHRISEIEGLSDKERSALLGLLRESKTYGLVWEDKPEAVEERLRDELPVLTEVKERALISDSKDAPNHILIEGDNLEALTTLAYTHAGRIDVIYIDPPYNTGNKDFVYNDSFVDREDTYRHSKWLSFMSRRLKIAKQLLSDKGVIFISIDDNEQAQLKLLCDEVFGEDGFLGDIIWEKTDSPRMDVKGFYTRHDYILVYKRPEFELKRIPQNNIPKHYNKVDEQGKRYYLKPLRLMGGHKSDSLYYGIQCPDGSIIFPMETNGEKGCWRWSKKKFEEENCRIEFIKSKKKWSVNYRIYADDLPDMPVSTIWSFEEVGSTRTAKTGLTQIVDQSIFSYPKPVSLIVQILKVASSNNSTVLDFFAGSGTTLHATMQLNAEDGGHRQCILVTNNENGICENVTYERNKRVIEGYTTPKGDKVEGLRHNNLRYYKTNFVPREPNNRNKRALVAAATDLLCVKNDVYQEQACFGGRKLKPTAARYFDEGKTQMLIIYNELAVDAFVKVIDGIEVAGRIKVYVFSNNRYAYNDNFEPVAEKVEVCALPAAIYDAYKQVLKPRKRNNMTSADAPFAEETSIETEQGTLNFKEEGGEA